jgi:hypothetical protein
MTIAALKPLPRPRADQNGAVGYRSFAAYYEDALIAEGLPILHRGSVDRVGTGP